MNQKPKVLVIDEDPRTGRTIKNFLILHKFDVCYAGNGTLGLQRVLEFKPDIILCEINMEPIDGIEIYNVVKESMGETQTSFIAMSRQFELKDIRKYMNMGMDDFIARPVVLDDLLRSIYNRLSKIRKLRNICLNEFNVLFNLSKDGVFLLDNFEITDANQAFLNMLDLNKEDLNNYTIENFFSRESIPAIKEAIQYCSNGSGNRSIENISIQTKNGLMKEASFQVGTCENSAVHQVMIGIVALNATEKATFDIEQSIAEVLIMLKRENIRTSASAVKRITEVLKHQNSNSAVPDCELFSKRENEVLNLSMEGMPTKLIADKLSLSDRTVEKYRSKLMEKTGSNNIIEVIHYALRNKLINL